MRYTLEGVHKGTSLTKKMVIGASGLLVASAVLVANVFAAAVPVTPSDPQGWGQFDMRGNGVAELSTE